MAASHNPPTPVAVGIRGVCPRCGQGPLFKSFINIELNEACPVCALNYKFIDTGDGPAWFAMLILCVAILGGALFVEFRYEPGFWVHAVLWGVLTPLFAILLLRFLKGTLIALQFKNKAEQGRLE